MARLLLQPRENHVRMEETVIGKHNDVLAVVGDRIMARRIDDDRTVVPLLLLQSGVRVIPISPRLADREFVGEARPRADAGKANARHAIHLERQD